MTTTKSKKIFGTDGVRGVANVEPVTAETALKLGRAAAHVFTTLNPHAHRPGLRPKIVLGKDTPGFQEGAGRCRARRDQDVSGASAGEGLACQVHRQECEQPGDDLSQSRRRDLARVTEWGLD